MKTCKAAVCIILFIMILISLMGCEQYEGPYPFRQDYTNIERIEICSHDRITRERTTIIELPEHQIEEMMERLSNLTYSKYGPGDHPRRYGALLICITYTDGEIELIGLTNIGWITPEGESNLSNYCVKEEKDLYDLITEFVDPDLMPDLKEEYPNWFS